MKLWIARCESGHLQLFEYRPTYNGKMWVNGWTSSIPLDDNKNSFPEVTFENSPQMVEVKLIKEE